MDIRQTILKEHSKNQALKIANYVGSDKVRFRELMNVFLEGEYRITQRAAWPLGFCGQNYPELLLPYTEKFIHKLKEKNIHDAVKRNILRVWQGIPIPEKYAGEIFGICYDFLRDTEEPIAIKVFSMTVMLNICKKHPVLKNELKILVEDMIPYGGPAIISRGRKVLKSLQKI